MKRFFRQVEQARMKRNVWRANLFSYAFLLLIALVMLVVLPR